MMNFIVSNVKSQNIKQTYSFIEKIYFALPAFMQYFIIISAFIVILSIIVGIFIILGKLVSHNIKIGKIQVLVPEEKKVITHIKHKKK